MISELCNICEGIMITNILDGNQVLVLIDYMCSVIIFSFFVPLFFSLFLYCSYSCIRCAVC